MRAEDNGNGRVTLALVVDRLEHLTKAFEEHDRWDRENAARLWDEFRRDHDRLITLELRLAVLEGRAVELAKADEGIRTDVAGLRKEARALGVGSNLLAAIATALGIGRGVPTP